MPKLTALEAVNQSIEFWEVLAETGKSKDYVIKKFPKQFNYLSGYENRCPCCEFTHQCSNTTILPNSFECRTYCPAASELGYCGKDSSYVIWKLHISIKDTMKAAVPILEALKAAKNRLGSK